MENGGEVYKAFSSRKQQQEFWHHHLTEGNSKPEIIQGRDIIMHFWEHAISVQELKSKKTAGGERGSWNLPFLCIWDAVQKPLLPKEIQQKKIEWASFNVFGAFGTSNCLLVPATQARQAFKIQRDTRGLVSLAMIPTCVKHPAQLYSASYTKEWALNDLTCSRRLAGRPSISFMKCFATDGFALKKLACYQRIFHSEMVQSQVCKYCLQSRNNTWVFQLFLPKISYT